MRAINLSILTLSILLSLANIGWAQKSQILIVEDKGSWADFWNYSNNFDRPIFSQSLPYFDVGDAFAVGDVLGDGLDEIISAEDNGGGVEIWTWSYITHNFNKVLIFESKYGSHPFDVGDAFVVGDVLGDSKKEIIIAEDNGGLADVWAWNTDTRSFSKISSIGTVSRSAFGWALTTGDVAGNPKEEIVVASGFLGLGDVRIWSWNIDTNTFEEKYPRFRSREGGTHPFDVGDAFVVGDVWGDSKEEIIIAEDNGGGIDVWTFDVPTNAFKIATSFNSHWANNVNPFDFGDAFIVGDVLGDSKEEIIIAEDNGGSATIWSWNVRTNRFENVMNFQSNRGHHPFDIHDAFVVGKCLGN